MTRFWLWLLLAAWPPELIAAWGGWDLVDPRYLGVMALWWPVDVFARLAALRAILMRGPRETGAPMGRPYIVRDARDAWGSAIAAEILLSLKFAGVALAGLLPGIALASRGHHSVALLVGALGLVPALFFYLRRSLSLLWLLQGPYRASEALQASAQQTQGRTGLFLRLAGPWLLLSLGLDLAGLGLPELGGLLLAPLSLGAGLWGLLRAQKGLG